MVSVFVRLTTAEKIVFEVDLQSTVKELKDLISQRQSVESDLITLVFKGKILKDDAILEDCGITEGSIVHMVVMKKKTQTTPKVSEPVQTSSSPSASPSRPEPVSSSTSSETNSQHPYSFMSMSGEWPSIDAGTAKGANDAMRKMMTEKPELFLSLLKMDPGMKNVLEKNPQMEAMLHDPATIDQLVEMMTDPEAMKAAQRQTDNALNEIGEIPGGEAMLERVMSQYYEPLEREKERRGLANKGSVDPAMAQQATIPNLWDNHPSPAMKPSSSPGSPAGMRGSSIDDMKNLNFVNHMVETNPELMIELLKVSPMYESLVKTNPQLASMLNDPQFLKQMFTKENLQFVQQLQPPSNYFPMDGFGMGTHHIVENLSPSDIRVRYPNAIQQMEDMGFTVDDHVLQVLHQFLNGMACLFQTEFLTLLLVLSIGSAREWCGSYNGGNSTLSYQNLQLFSDGTQITSFKLQTLMYSDPEYKSFLLGWTYHYYPESSFSISEDAIEGKSIIQHVYGIYGSMYANSLKCSTDWSVMSELDVSSMSCTLDGSDAFASLKPYLGKEETIKIEATETGILMKAVMGVISLRPQPTGF
ncbi:hypothetical protein WA171_001001 [Blastocystis sp. BT1]